jgi:hypothetical protein
MLQQVTIKTRDRATLKPLLESAIENEMNLLSLGLNRTRKRLANFKRGERWAWYALWVWPLWNVAIFGLSFTAERQPGFPPPPPMISSPIFFTVTLLALILSYRKFYPRMRQ